MKNNKNLEKIKQEIDKIFKNCPDLFFLLYKDKDVKKEILEKTLFFIKNNNFSDTELSVFNEALKNSLKIYSDEDIKTFLKENKKFEQKIDEIEDIELKNKSKKILTNLNKVKILISIYKKCTNKIIKSINILIKQKKDSK